MPALIVGNWKMNGLGDDIAEIAQMAGSGARGVWIAPPFTLIDRAVIVSAGAVKIGGQDCHAKAQGAHTGCVSALMLADLGAGFVIVGHSERRRDNGETCRCARQGDGGPSGGAGGDPVRGRNPRAA